MASSKEVVLCSTAGGVKRSAKEAKSVFLIELTYKADLDAIDRAMAPHMAYLKKYYDAGNFVFPAGKFRATAE